MPTPVDYQIPDDPFTTKLAGITGDRCDKGLYCPEGTSSIANQNCKAGTYNPNEGAHECLTCPEGFYCLEGDPADTATHEPIECAKGHRCPRGTGTEFGIPCDNGQYQDETGHTRCFDCPPGHACSGAAKEEVTTADYCDAGYYCGIA